MDTDRLSTQSWSDRDFVLRVVKKSGHSLQFASKELRADKAVVLEALRQNGHALTYASKELRSNKQVVLEAVRQEGFALFHASKHLQADKEVVLEVVKQNGEALPIATVGLRTDKDVVLEAIRHDGQFLEYANKEHRHCRDIVLEAVRQRGAALRLASVELQADREIVFEAVKQDLLGFAARCARSRTFGNHPATEAMFAYWGVQFARASPLAVRGEEAPTVSFKLLQRPRQQQPQDQEEETRRRQQQQQQQQPSEDSRTTASATSFQCEAFLLSGATFKFCIPDHKSSKPKENQRHYPILNDLAEKLLEELQKDHKVRPNKNYTYVRRARLQDMTGSYLGTRPRSESSSTSFRPKMGSPCQLQLGIGIGLFTTFCHRRGEVRKMKHQKKDEGLEAKNFEVLT